MKKLNRNYLNILLLFTRDPFANHVLKEIEAYHDESESLLGLISFDNIDRDYYAAILSRDNSKQFRLVKAEASIQTVKKAQNWIRNEFESKEIIIQDHSEFFDLFSVKVNPKQLSPDFENVKNHEAYLAAKKVVEEISFHYKDIDGNFISQFQSKNGFDARVWELYLYCLFREEQFRFKRNSYSPDYVIAKAGYEIAIEAVIIARSTPIERSLEDIRNMDKDAQLKNEVPLKFGSALFSKLNKKYWELPNVAGKPLIFAIADFHDTFSMVWTYSALIEYLYGVSFNYTIDEKGNLEFGSTSVSDYTKVSGSKVPAGFFALPGAENVSAILFSNTGTIGKFNRMGVQAGLGSNKSTIVRHGTCHNFDRNATVPNIFNYIVDTNCNELWSEGVSIFHNPNAKLVLEDWLFPNVAHHHFRNNELLSMFPDFFPYNSINTNLYQAED